MSEEEKAVLRGESVTEQPSIKRPLCWAIVWFILLVAARVASVHVAAWFGLDESNQYLLVQPITFASGLALMLAGYLAVIKFGFPNTLGKDMGTRFNAAFAKLDDPFKILMVYAAFTAPVVVALGLMLANR